VEVCPVNCFYECEKFLMINPDEGIDCGACVPESPVGAIFSQDDLPAKWSEYLKLNATLAANWPVITAKKPGLVTRNGGRRSRTNATSFRRSPSSSNAHSGNRYAFTGRDM